MKVQALVMAQHVPESLVLLVSLSHLHQLVLFAAVPDPHRLLSRFPTVFFRNILQLDHMLDDPLHTSMVFYHLLVVATALVGRAGFDVQTKQFIDFAGPAIFHC